MNYETETTFQDRYETAKQRLNMWTGKDDTVVTLDSYDHPEYESFYEKRVLISACGWVDFLSSRTESSANGDSFHYLALTPSEMETLISRYRQWQYEDRVRTEYRELRYVPVFQRVAHPIRADMV